MRRVLIMVLLAGCFADTGNDSQGDSTESTTTGTASSSGSTASSDSTMPTNGTTSSAAECASNDECGPTEVCETDGDCDPAWGHEFVFTVDQVDVLDGCAEDADGLDCEPDLFLQITLDGQNALMQDDDESIQGPPWSWSDVPVEVFLHEDSELTVFFWYDVLDDIHVSDGILTHYCWRDGGGACTRPPEDALHDGVETVTWTDDGVEYTATFAYRPI